MRNFFDRANQGRRRTVMPAHPDAWRRWCGGSMTASALGAIRDWE
ncbi:Hypothetical protein A7982_03268 [Minicystis rosea]|nr:Hypothetical protein A7982_03268 [Minicystis rosea]